MVSPTNARDGVEVDTIEEPKARLVERVDSPHYESMGVSEFTKFKANYLRNCLVKFR